MVYNSVRTYLFSLVTEIKLRGGKDILDKDKSWYIDSTLKYYKRTNGTLPQIYRRPITVDMLPKIIEITNLEDFSLRSMATMIVVGVFGCFRIGEICFKKKYYIRNKDVKLTKNGTFIHLRNTKTDTEKKGVNKFLANILSSSINPSNLLYSLRFGRLIGNKPDDPFFINKHGKPITRHMLVNFIKTTMKRIYPHIPESDWNGISLRKGGATSAMRVGINQNTIQQLGNWKSNIYKSYIDSSTTEIARAQLQMAEHSIPPPTNV